MSDPKPVAPTKPAEAAPCATCGKPAKSAWGVCSTHRKDSAEYRAYDAALCRWLRAEKAEAERVRAGRAARWAEVPGSY